jgi:PEP-CTERM motif
MKRITLLLLLSAGSVALAGPFTTAGVGNITNAAYAFAAGGGLAPTFNANHELTAAGNNLGSVGAAATALVNTGGNFPGSLFQCENLGGTCGNIAAPFGTASTWEGSGNYSIGFFFALSDPGPNGQASVTYADATNVVFTNTSNNAVTGYVGAALAIHGFFGGQANAVVGAALDGAISWNGGVAQEATVVLFGSSNPGQPTSIFTSGVGVTGGSYFNCGFAFGCNDFIAWGVSLLNGGAQITIPANQSLNLTGALSVVADPISFSGIFDLDPGGVVPGGTILPTFGTASTVPEPATWLLVGGGLLALAWRRRRTAASPQ